VIEQYLLNKNENATITKTKFFFGTIHGLNMDDECGCMIRARWVYRSALWRRTGAARLMAWASARLATNRRGLNGSLGTLAQGPLDRLSAWRFHRADVVLSFGRDERNSRLARPAPACVPVEETYGNGDETDGESITVTDQPCPWTSTFSSASGDLAVGGHAAWHGPRRRVPTRCHFLGWSFLLAFSFGWV